jgi:uncharacterized surface protein with fasciclin (FAS1) repeats
MKTAVCLLVLVAVAGVANAQYASVMEAVQKIPEVSTIAKRVGAAGALTKTLSDPNWVGTVFIPTNAALERISSLLGMDLFEMVSDPAQMEEVLGSSVVPGVILDSTTVKEGQKLKAQSGETLTVSFKNPAAVKLEAGGKTIYIQSAPVSTADVAAGKASLWLMSAPVLNKEYQSMLDSLQGETPAPAAPSTKSAKPAAAATPVAAAAKPAATPAIAVDAAADVMPVTDKAADAVATSATPAADASADAATPAAAAPAAATPAPTKSSAGTASLAAAVLAVPALMALLL